jgi:hypothetical protein
VKIFDLEQEIMECWHVVEDIDMVTAWFINDPRWEGMEPALADALMNKYSAIKQLYELRFEKLWSTFEEVCGEHHKYRKLSLNERESFDD